MVGRHFLFGSSVNDRYALCAGSYGDSGCIHGYISTANDHDPLFSRTCLFKVFLAKERHRIHYSVRIFIFNIHFDGNMGPYSKEYGVKALVFKACQGKITAQSHAGFKRDPCGQNMTYFLIQYGWRQPVIRDTGSQHTTRFFHGLKYANLKSLAP